MMWVSRICISSQTLFLAAARLRCVHIQGTGSGMLQLERNSLSQADLETYGQASLRTSFSRGRRCLRRMNQKEQQQL